MEKTIFNLLQFAVLEKIVCLRFCSKVCRFVNFLTKTGLFCHNSHSFVTTKFEKVGLSTIFHYFLMMV